MLHESSIYSGPNTAADRNEPIDDHDYDGPPAPAEDEYGYRIHEQPMGTKRRVKVLIMGAGASALSFFKMAEDEMTDLDIVCYEKNGDVGGTWLENRYPGCACDIPSVNYQFSWKVKLWSHYWSYAPEIWRYLKDIEEEGDYINKYIKLRHQIEQAQFDKSTGQWRFRIRNLETDEVAEDSAEFFINGGGVLNKWKWPDITGLHDFRGKLMHSARYEEGYDLKGKKVAVIGAGSSGVQIVAAIQKEVDTLYHWVRSPIWITAGFGQTWSGKDGANFAYSKEQLEYLEKNPEKYMEYRKQIEDELNQRFKFIIRGSEEARKGREFALDQMRRKLKYDERLCEKMIPKNFNPGCRRPTPAPGYLEALVAENAQIFTDEINKIDETGFTDSDGTHHDCDVIICATGFDTTWIPRFPIANGAGMNLQDLWAPTSTSAGKPSVTAYLSVGVPQFENFFSYCGPYGPLGHGSFMPLIECWTRYFFSVIRKAQVENIKSFAPKQEVCDQFRRHADHFLKRTAWTSPCRSWFKQGTVDGQVVIYPGSRLHHLELMKEPRYEDYEIEYWDAKNMWGWLGNGFETREFDGRDITYYWGQLEPGQDKQPEYTDDLKQILAGWALDDEYVVSAQKGNLGYNNLRASGRNRDSAVALDGGGSELNDLDGQETNGVAATDDI